MINKTEFIDLVAKKVGATKKDTTVFVNAILDVIKDNLVKGEKIQFSGFGSFEVKTRSAHKGRNPQTGEEINIPASKSPVFKVGTILKDAVNK